ncbi:MAG: hypothetical protein ABI600_01000 [Luteolibacter sp.]
MQRWIVIGVVAMAMMFGGGFFAFRTYKQNRPYPVWVPLPINPELPIEKQDQLAKELKTKLCDRETLIQVSRDLRLMYQWQMTSDAQCADELAKRIFVKAGETGSGLNHVPSIDIGVGGKTKERDLSGKIALRLMEDVRKILGNKPPQK